MFKRFRPYRVVLVLGIVAALSLGVTAMFTEVEAKGGRCICPQIYAPVECKGGKVFANQCLADCRNAKDCVPLGAL